MRNSWNCGTQRIVPVRTYSWSSSSSSMRGGTEAVTEIRIRQRFMCDPRCPQAPCLLPNAGGRVGGTPAAAAFSSPTVNAESLFRFCFSEPRRLHVPHRQRPRHRCHPDGRPCQVGGSGVTWRTPGVPACLAWLWGTRVGAFLSGFYSLSWYVQSLDCSSGITSPFSLAWLIFDYVSWQLWRKNRIFF